MLSFVDWSYDRKTETFHYWAIPRTWQQRWNVYLHLFQSRRRADSLPSWRWHRYWRCRFQSIDLRSCHRRILRCAENGSCTSEECAGWSSTVCSELLFELQNTDRTKSSRHLSAFITKLFQVYMELQFTYLEINPLIVTPKSVHVLDLASRLDQTAEYLCASKWGRIVFPPPFGREAYAEVILSLIIMSKPVKHFRNPF